MGTRLQSVNVLLIIKKSATMYLMRFAKTFKDLSLQSSTRLNVMLSMINIAGQSMISNATTSPTVNVLLNKKSNARMFQTKNVQQNTRMNVEKYKNRFAIQLQKGNAVIALIIMAIKRKSASKFIMMFRNKFVSRFLGKFVKIYQGNNVTKLQR